MVQFRVFVQNFIHQCRPGILPYSITEDAYTGQIFFDNATAVGSEKTDHEFNVFF
jgi:hypothetical protein